jgi:hypothetical protein
MATPTDLSDQPLAGLLERAAECEALLREVAVEQLRVAYEWAIAHPVIDSGVESSAGPTLTGVLDAPETLGGAGTPAVAAFTAEPFAVACGLSPAAATGLLADSLDLHHRLPVLWTQVQAGFCAVWKARRIAARTRGLSLDAALWVDRHIGARASSVGKAQLDRVIAQAAARVDGDSTSESEADAKAGWDVRLLTRDPAKGAGTLELHAVGGALDVTRFHDLVCAEAETLGQLGDGDAFEARKAKALGVIADAQARLDLTTLLVPDSGVTLTEQAQVRRRIINRRDAKVRLYLHASLADYATADVDVLDASAPTAIGTVEGLGPVTLDQIREWVNAARVTVVPVLHTTAEDTWSVDRHDPPPRMAETVRLREATCVFPWCQHPARHSDLDHIKPYVDPNAGGPPGQTTPGNLAPLCRRHHRLKTSGRWRYDQPDPGVYTWTGPGVHAMVTPKGTLTLPN